jgi:hypothetical protein
MTEKIHKLSQCHNLKVAKPHKINFKTFQNLKWKLVRLFQREITRSTP